MRADQGGPFRATALTLLVAAAAGACGTRQALGGGLGVMKLEVGGGFQETLEPVLALRLGVPDSGFRGLLVVDLQPVPIQNPAGDEGVSTLFLLPSLQATGGPVGLRGGIGPALDLWSGADAAGSFSTALAAQAAITLDVRRARRKAWSVELFATAAGDIDTSGHLAGIQLVKYVR